MLISIAIGRPEGRLRPPHPATHAHDGRRFSPDRAQLRGRRREVAHGRS